ncbi:MAG: 1-acyl-sn-glycerol-3-phosphate acyltransferase [Dehalococcoidia bacterium]
MGAEVRISLRALAPRGTPAQRWLSIVGPVLDRLLKIRAIDRRYRQSGLAGLPPFEFSARVLSVLNVSVDAAPERWLDQVPREGPVLVVCNHPYGGIEALILAAALKSVRTDTKFLANAALRVFREFAPLIITTNPLAVTQKNLSSIRQCEAHLRSGGVLVVFPAGRVSFDQHEKARISDGAWNRVAGHLALRTEAALLPVWFDGANSRLFHVLGRLWDRSKLLMLPRELLKLQGRHIRFRVGRPIAASVGVTRMRRA